MEPEAARVPEGSDTTRTAASGGYRTAVGTPLENSAQIVSASTAAARRLRDG